MSKISLILKAAITDGAILILFALGVLFAASGFFLCPSALKMAQTEAQWKDSIATAGRVIAVESKQKSKENSILVMYAYKDNQGTIFHSTVILPHKFTKISFVPESTVSVVYNKDNHALSRLKIDLPCLSEWLPILIIGLFEIAFSAIFFVSSFDKLSRQLKSEP